MDRVRFGYAVDGTEAYPQKTFEGGEYMTPHAENLLGEIIEESGTASEELSGLTTFEKIAQAKKWRNAAKTALTDCQDAVLIAELCADREKRAGACVAILQSIAEIVDYNLDYALDVLYRRCNIYNDASQDFIRIRHHISAADNADMMSSIDEFIETMFDIAKMRADRVVDSCV